MHPPLPAARRRWRRRTPSRGDARTGSARRPRRHGPFRADEALRFVDVEELGLRKVEVVARLRDLGLLRHLPVNPLPPSGLEGNAEDRPLLREHDFWVLTVRDADVPLPPRD